MGFSERDCLFFGKVMGIRPLISYEGPAAKELIEDFHEAVEDYLALCEVEYKNKKKHVKIVSMCVFLLSFTNKQ